MLAKRIIPCLDVHAGRVVKGVNFVQLRDAGDPVEIATRYEEQGADELVFLDRLAKERVLAVPGRGFGMPGYFRLAFCVDEAVINRSEAGFARAIRG